MVFGIGLALLDCMIKVAKNSFDTMEEDEEEKENSPRSEMETGKGAFMRAYSFSKTASPCHSPLTPTSVLSELPNYPSNVVDFAFAPSSPSFLWPLRMQAVGKLNPIDLKRLSFHMYPFAVPKDSGSCSIQKTSTVKELEQEVEEESSSQMAVVGPSEEKPDTVMVDLNERSRSEDGDENASEAQKLNMSPPPSPPSPPAPTQSSQPTPMPQPKVAAPQPPPLQHSPSETTAPPQASLPLRNPVAPPPPPPLPMLRSNGAALPSPGPPPPSGNAPPLPPLATSKGTGPPPPQPPLSLTKGGAPPPPPPGGGAKNLRPKKAATKLKRSTQMGNLYRVLKGKVEGSSLEGKSSKGRKGTAGNSAGGKQGMADALAEMTKRFLFR